MPNSETRPLCTMTSGQAQSTVMISLAQDMELPLMRKLDLTRLSTMHFTPLVISPTPRFSYIDVVSLALIVQLSSTGSPPKLSVTMQPSAMLET